MAPDATAAAKELHSKGYERVPDTCDQQLLRDAPSLAPALTNPSFVNEVNERLTQMWSSSDSWKRMA